jgi:hypothetical protein
MHFMVIKSLIFGVQSHYPSRQKKHDYADKQRSLLNYFLALIDGGCRIGEDGGQPRPPRPDIRIDRAVARMPLCRGVDSSPLFDEGREIVRTMVVSIPIKNGHETV